MYSPRVEVLVSGQNWRHDGVQLNGTAYTPLQSRDGWMSHCSVNVLRMTWQIQIDLAKARLYGYGLYSIFTVHTSRKRPHCTVAQSSTVQQTPRCITPGGGNRQVKHLQRIEGNPRLVAIRTGNPER